MKKRRTVSPVHSDGKVMNMSENMEKNTHKAQAKKGDRPAVSQAVIKRLPRYFRYLRILLRDGRTRISSNELAEMMNVTASQIRQDLNCFGGFGQQGYGYNVTYLYAKICELLGVGAGYTAIIVGAGNLGRAIVKNPMFEKRGVDTIARFDVSPELIDTTVGGVRVYDCEKLEDFCRNHTVDIAVLTLPKEQAVAMAERLDRVGVRGIWNFTGQELRNTASGAVVENVHLGDSLMKLCYALSKEDRDDKHEN